MKCTVTYTQGLNLGIYLKSTTFEKFPQDQNNTVDPGYKKESLIEDAYLDPDCRSNSSEEAHI